jgi:nucleoside-diphosphate-sugar epimerase
LVPYSSPSKINGSVFQIWNVLIGDLLEQAGLPSIRKGFVDVRDVARFVKYSIELAEQIDGERYILCTANGPAQSVADILRKAYPDRRDVIQEGKPGHGHIMPGYAFTKERGMDRSKASKAMGPYIPWEKTVLDTAKSLEHFL